MTRNIRRGLLAGALTLATAFPAGAQQVEQDFLEPGVMAPDVEFAGATRHGVLRDPVRLSDYRGETVVLAFFFRARTRG